MCFADDGIEKVLELAASGVCPLVCIKFCTSYLTKVSYLQLHYEAFPTLQKLVSFDGVSPSRPYNPGFGFNINLFWAILDGLPLFFGTISAGASSPAGPYNPSPGFNLFWAVFDGSLNSSAFFGSVVAYLAEPYNPGSGFNFLLVPGNLVSPSVVSSSPSDVVSGSVPETLHFFA